MPIGAQPGHLRHQLGVHHVIHRAEVTQDRMRDALEFRSGFCRQFGEMIKINRLFEEIAVGLARFAK